MKAFVDKHFHHFNARFLKRAARDWARFDQRGGKMFVSVAGAMSTGGLGSSLVPLIMRGKIAGLCVTGANLEESLFAHLFRQEYQDIEDFRLLNRADDGKIRDQGGARVTDTVIPNDVFINTYQLLRPHILRAIKDKKRLMPHEILSLLFDRQDEEIGDCWLYAAWKKGIPIFVPGWEDSTIGNMLVADHMKTGEIPLDFVKSGLEQMKELVNWYEKTSAKWPLGFFQIGGGIAGDFPICVVPLCNKDLLKNLPYWQYFCQISDSPASYGSYSGALPWEKITWDKLDVDCPMHTIESDATIVFPLIASYVLGDSKENE